MVLYIVNQAESLLEPVLHPIATLWYGSRVAGGAGPDSDLDVIAVVQSVRSNSEVSEVAGRLQQALGFPVDLKLTTRRGAHYSHVMSPEWRVAFTSGIRRGDWSWFDDSLPLAWQGVDDYLSDTELQLRVAEDEDDLQLQVLDFLRVLRRLMTIRAAITNVPAAAREVQWPNLASEIGVPLENIRALQIDTTRLRAVVLSLLAESRAALESYEKNAGDNMLPKLLSNHGGSDSWTVKNDSKVLDHL